MNKDMDMSLTKWTERQVPSIERERTDRGRETMDEQRKIDGRKNSSRDKTQKETK